MTQSNIKPNKFQIIGEKIYLRENIVEETRDDEIVFLYDEYILNLKKRPNMEQYIENNFDALLIYVKNQIKEEQILKAKIECTEAIYAGFDSDCLGETKHFDCDSYDQNNISGLAFAAMMGLQGLTTEEVHWKASGELECYKFEYTQMLQLATDMKKHVETCINEFNAKRKAILGVE